MRLNRLAGLTAAGLLALAVAVPAGAATAKLTYVITDDGGTPTAGKVWVRVLHGSPDAPAVEVRVGAAGDLDGTARVDGLSGLAFGDVSDYAEVDPGDYAIRVCADGTDTCVINVESLTLAADTKYTIAASNKLADIDANVIVDDPAANAEQAQVRVAHLSADTPAVDVLTQDGSTKVFTNASYQDVTDYLALDPAEYDLKVCANADNSVCPLDLPAVTVEAGGAYTVYAIGSLAAATDMPPTDTVGEPAGTSSNGFAALLLAAAAALGVAGSLRYAAARNRAR